MQEPQSVIYHPGDDILLADLNVDHLEKKFEEVKKISPCLGLQIAPEKIQREDSINYLRYKIGLQKNQPQMVQIRKAQLQSAKDFQKFLGDINWLQPIAELTTQELRNSFQTYMVTRT